MRGAGELWLSISRHYRRLSVHYNICSHPHPTKRTALEEEGYFSLFFPSLMCLSGATSGWMSSCREAMSHSRTLWRDMQLLQGRALLGTGGLISAGVTGDDTPPCVVYRIWNEHTLAEHLSATAGHWTSPGLLVRPRWQWPLTFPSAQIRCITKNPVESLHSLYQ